MKSRFIKILCAAIALMSVPPSAMNAEVKREHRSVWLSPFLGEWPSAPLNTESNVKRQISNLNTALDRMQENNVNTLYFHVRSMCDACYESSYEPWADKVAGSRGGDAPLLDPLRHIIDECHSRGIELYAWVNPYRYSDKGAKYGPGELNYENSHPDWILTKPGVQSILNPGIAEVRQRIVDVCREIITKYDVDGLIFDDYFYTNMSESDVRYDDDLFKASGAKDYWQWRRDNVNAMVKDVADMVKATKPYLPFGISPAGKCNPPNASTYGLPASGMTDWQYKGIGSDPIYWLSNHLVDFVSPQLYWSTNGGFISDSNWWANAGDKLGRHIFVSTSTELTTAAKGSYKSDEYIQQQLHLREIQQPDQSGLAFFTYGLYNTYREKDPDLGRNMPLAHFMRKGVYQNKALSPMRYWRNEYAPVMVSNVAADGSTLAWDGIEGMRYTVYAVPETLTDAEFGCQPQYLEGVSYQPTFTIPEDKTAGYRWAVCVYDRYGNEYAPLMAGATPGQCSAPKLLSPADNAGLIPLSNFSWDCPDGTSFIIEIAADNDEKTITQDNLLGSFDTDSREFSSASLPELTPGTVYLWRVKAMGPNKLNAVSDVRRFVADKIKVLSPTENDTEISRTPTVTWQKAVDGVAYKLDIATTDKFTSIKYSVETTETSAVVPDYTLSTGVTYYARVTATLGGKSSQSDPVKFTIAPVDYTDAPVFTNPVVDGQTIFSNQTISLAPWAGLYDVRIEVSELSTFPSRGATFVNTLSNFATETKPLGEIKIQSKPLVDGKTYYLRARGSYKKDNKNYYTPYTELMTFVYDASAGVEDILDNTGGATVTGYYDLRGVRYDRPQPGVNIVRLSDGSARKIVVTANR